MPSNRKTSPTLYPSTHGVAAALIFALWAAGPAAAQCPWGASPACAGVLSPHTQCVRSFAAPQECGAPVMMGPNIACQPAAPATVLGLTARQDDSNPTTAAYCQWDCGGQICRINLSDGLPVELMGFEVVLREISDEVPPGEGAETAQAPLADDLGSESASDPS